MSDYEFLNSKITSEGEAVKLTLQFLGFYKTSGGMWHRPISSLITLGVWQGYLQDFKTATQIFGGRYFNKRLSEVERYACLNISRILLEVHKQWRQRNVQSNN
jgi:hypothetical protein